MRIRLGILQTRVARRVLLLFLLCAVLPVTALSVFSYYSVRNQLLSESQDRLLDATKNAGLALVERFQFLENTARLVVVPMARVGILLESENDSPLDRSSAMEEFEAAVVSREGAGPIPLFGTMAPPQKLSAQEADHLANGLALVRVRRTTDGPPEILMALEIQDGADSVQHIWVRLSLDFLLSTVEAYSALRSTVGFCVIQANRAPLFCSLPEPEPLGRAIAASESEDQRTGGSLPYRVIGWTDGDGEDYLAAARPIFLRPQFFLPSLTVSVSEARTTALSSIARFRSAFWGVILLCVVAVALLSNIQIRRSLDPLFELHRGTKRLADGDLGERVSVSSNDEFEDLAESFNSMAVNLEGQFRTLATIAEMDRAILSDLDSDQIIETALARVGDLLSCDRVAVCRLNWLGAREGSLRVGSPKSGTLGPKVRVLLADGDRQLLDGMEDSALLDGADQASQYFGIAPGEAEISMAIMAPLRLSEGLAGYLAVGRSGEEEFTDSNRTRIDQIAKQLSIALSNAWLVEELDRMSWGALTALGRTIDAKSPWTSGHSEQVAILSETLGREMGLPEADLTALQRGGLVHDIGKIAVPGAILDKRGSLTPEEFEVIRSHPEVGVRILEPIPAMEPILPMVLHHHEAWDGSGYPMGLAGDKIPLEARIMAVADQFEALSSDRPYRAGFGIQECVSILREKAGTDLDPQVVDTFITLLEAGKLPVQLGRPTEVLS